jgi:hypothetical protein
MAYYWNKKGTADSYKQIDVRYMQREGFLTEGRKSYLTWTTTRTGQVVGRVNYEVRQDSLCISYNARKDSSEAWRPYEYHVPLTYTACNYGGSRIWAKCPHCHKRSPRVAPKKITENKKALHFCKALILQHILVAMTGLEPVTPAL